MFGNGFCIIYCLVRKKLVESGRFELKYFDFQLLMKFIVYVELVFLFFVNDIIICYFFQVMEIILCCIVRNVFLFL